MLQVLPVGGFRTAALIAVGVLGFGAPLAGADWRDDYAVPMGFRIDRDVTGLEFPTAIAFVPNPGSGPKDPLYFVTEIRGAIKVVTNDRTVHTFAEGFGTVQTPKAELPATEGQVGLAGICLEPEHGYVFVSFVYQDAEGFYRNAVMRFDAQPGVFGLKPTAQHRLLPVLDQFQTTISHQIGPLATRNGKVFVCVGDAERPLEARNLDAPNGKILCMDFEGRPPPDNPYRVDDDPMKIRNYVWSLGLRNPFGLDIVQGRIFITENGGGLDRFVEVDRGRDFLFSGDDATIAANALFVWKPAISPVQLDFDEGQAARAGFPEIWQSQFYITLSGGAYEPPGPSQISKSVETIGFDFGTGRVSSAPQKFLRYIGSGVQYIVGVGLGPDGVYVVPLMPDVTGESAVLKITYNPTDPHPHSIESNRHVGDIIAQRACRSCHNIDVHNGHRGVGPDIDRLTFADELIKRLNSPEYAAQVAEVDALDVEPYRSFKAAREEVRRATGQTKAKLWVKYRLLEPRFDQKLAAMPQLGLTEPEAEAVARWLVEPNKRMALRLRKWDQTMPAFIRDPLHKAYQGFKYGDPKWIIGLPLTGLVVLVGLGWGWRRWRKRRRARTT